MAVAKTSAIEQFAAMFEGYEKAHGEHVLFDKPDENGKIKGRASTKGTGATLKMYHDHLLGAGTSLGIVPLKANDCCRMGAIDIDIEGPVKLHETVEHLEARVRKMELPLVVCKSKSGGAHLYLFCSEDVPAKIIVARLTQFAAALGYGGTEIFPKQIMRANEQDRGNWINISFYGALSKEGTTRFCIRNGKPVKKLEDFLAYAKLMMMGTKDIESVELKLSDNFRDGPPCLQHLATFGIEQGGRNVGLTNIAIYNKIAHPDDWQDRTNKFSYENMSPPVGQSDLVQITRNVSRKDYFYTCKQPPLSTHCDKKLCVKRKFGIGSGKDAGELFPVDNLTKCIAKDSVRWYAEHQGLRVELTTEQLLSPPLLQRVFLERFSMIVIGKQKDWMVRLKELMETCEEIIDPDDASRQGQFENMLDNFFNSSRPARNRDELIKGNSFVEEGRIHFRSEDLFKYLTIHRFQSTPHEIWLWLKQLKATDKQMRIKGKMIRVWTLPEPEKFDGSAIDLPKNMEEDL